MFCSETTVLSCFVLHFSKCGQRDVFFCTWRCHSAALRGGKKLIWENGEERRHHRHDWERRGAPTEGYSPPVPTLHLFRRGLRGDCSGYIGYLSNNPAGQRGLSGGLVPGSACLLLAPAIWPASTIKLTIVSIRFQLIVRTRRSEETRRGMARVYSDSPFRRNND